MKRAVVTTFVVWLVAVSASAETSRRVVRITPDGSPNAMEVSVAINPTRPENIVCGLAPDDRPGGATTPTSASTAGQHVVDHRRGRTLGRTQADDVVVFDDQGRAYWAYISFLGIRVDRPKNAANGIFVNRSHDGGRTWSDPIPVIDHVNSVEPFEDKPWITAGPDGHLYVAWTRFSKYGTDDPGETSHIYFSVSEDAGKTFAMPMRVSDEPGDAVDDDDTVEGVVPAVGIDGTVYLVWSGPRRGSCSTRRPMAAGRSASIASSRAPGRLEHRRRPSHACQRDARDRRRSQRRPEPRSPLRELGRRPLRRPRRVRHALGRRR